MDTFPIQSTDTETFATLLVNEVICRYGTPSCLHSDQGTNFISNLMAAECNLLGIKQSHTSSYHPHISAAHKRNKSCYDKQKPFSPFQVGDQVWLFTPVVKPGTTKKFTSQWRRPYTVLDRVNRVNYCIKLVESSAKPQVIHHNRLKLCYGTPQQTTTSMQHQSSTVQTRPL